MTDEEVFKKQQERFQQFLKCLDRLSQSTAKGNALADKQIEVMALLYDALTKKDDGLIDAIDDMIEETGAMRAEMQGLRQDLQAFTRAVARIGAAPAYPPRRP